MRSKRLLLFLFIVFGLAQCPIALHAAERYADAEKGFSLEIPAGWVIQEHYMGTEVAAYSTDPAARLTANVVVEDLPEGITLDDYFEVSVAMVEASLQNFVEYERGRTALNGTPARWLLYSYGSGQLAFQALAYLMVSGKTGYVLTCGSTPETFTQARPLLERVAGTFRLESRGRAENQAGNAPPEITVRTQPEPAPSEAPPQPRTSLPPAPAGNAFTIAIEQDGQPVQVIGHTARLRKKPFVLVFTFRAPDGVLVNASVNPQSYEAARAASPLKEIVGFGSPGLVEGARNTEQEIVLCDTDYQYWFYSTPSINRFDKTSEEGGLIVCRRTVARILLADKQRPLPIERFAGEVLYLVLIKADRPNHYAESREYQRAYLELVFGD